MYGHSYKRHELWICFFGINLESYDGMSLTKIPFILLATWGINMSYTSPNPPPPQNERFSSSAPLENSGLLQWGPIVGRVSKLFRRYFSKKKLTKRTLR